MHSSAEKEIVRGIKEEVCYVAFDPEGEEKSLKISESREKMKVKYKLPDGNVIDVISKSPF